LPFEKEFASEESFFFFESLQFIVFKTETEPQNKSSSRLLETSGDFKIF